MWRPLFCSRWCRFMMISKVIFRMITPVFTLKQNDEFLLIEIKAPYAKIQETEIEYFDKMFYFSSVPYYLRLHLPCNVVQDDESCVTYDHDEEKFIIKARKLRHGEFFPNLDMIGELLNPSSMIKVNNLVEECGDNDDEFCMVQECGNSSQEVIDGVCHSYGYGFGWRRHNVFEKLDREISNIIDLRDPDNTSIDERTELCLQQDINQFNPDRYAVDLHEPDDVLKLSLNYRLPETCFELSEKNRQHLQDLARKKAPSLTEACTESLMLSLIDILFAYLYELRTTEGEYNVESGWTIAKLSPTLAYLLRWKDADEAVLGCVRRALCYPIFRHWQLCLKVFRDLKTVLSKDMSYDLQMSGHLYRKFLQVAARWPREPNKSTNRDPSVFIKNEIERFFKSEKDSIGADPILCQRRLKSLEDLVSNAHNNNYPHSYKSGTFGLDLNQLEEINSKYGRMAIGLSKRPSLYGRLKSYVFTGQ